MDLRLWIGLDGLSGWHGMARSGYGCEMRVHAWAGLNQSLIDPMVVGVCTWGTMRMACRSAVLAW